MTKNQRLTAISIWIIAVLLFAFSIYVKFVYLFKSKNDLLSLIKLDIVKYNYYIMG